MSAVATITRDRINTGKDAEHSRKGWTFGDETLSAGTVTHKFKLIDDDDIVYYEGIIIATSEDDADELAERLWEWGAYDAGTVTIDVDGDRPFG